MTRAPQPTGSETTTADRHPTPPPAELAVVDTLDWGTFVAEHWDRRPVLITSPNRLPFETSEVFHSAVSGTAPPRPGAMPVNVQFTVDRYQQTEPGSLLPEPRDGSLAGYAERMREELPGHRYVLVVHTFHTFHGPMWRRQRDFYAGLWDRVGIPEPGAITTLFHGSYEHSPVGVHKDRFATFMYALHGRKRMRFWTSCPWQEPVSSMLDYTPYLASSTVVEVEPGQLLYWPSNYFHVGENSLDDEPATSVNVGVPRSDHRAAYDIQGYLFDPTPASLLDTDSVPVPIAEPHTTPVDAGDILLVPPEQAGADLDEDLPAALVRPLQELRTATAAARRDERVALLSLRRWTGGGFLPAPPPDEQRAVNETDRVRLRDPVRWSDTQQGPLCGANGRAGRTTLQPRHLSRLLSALEPGTAQPVAEILAAVPAEQRTHARQVLVMLESLGAVTVARTTSGSAGSGAGNCGARRD